MLRGLAFGLCLLAAPVAAAQKSDVREPGSQPPRPLTGRGLDNLVSFTRILGVVQHFHPADETLAVDWDQFAIHAVDRMECAESATELADAIDELFWPIAPSLVVWEGTLEDEPELEDDLSQAATTRVGIVNLGLGPAKTEDGQRSANSLYQSTVVREPLELPASRSRLAPSGATWRSELPGGVSVRVPLTVFADEEGTLPEGLEQTEHESARPSGWSPSGDDRATRLAAVAIAWNLFQHFYPYFDVVEVDWMEVLRDCLEQAAVDRGEVEFFATLSHLVAAIEDGHGNTYHSSTSKPYTLPLLLEFVGPDLVVVYADSDRAESIRVGDTVLAIDGRNVDELYKGLASLTCTATEQWMRHKLAGQLGASTEMSSAVLQLKSSEGIVREEKLTRVPLASLPRTEKRPANGSELSPGIRYFSLVGTTREELEKHLEILAEADGIIFDLRGYPGSGGSEIFPHLANQTLHSAWWNVPLYLYPDQQQVEFRRSRWDLEPRQPQLTQNRVFLTHGGAISYAESCMGIVEGYNLAPIVGEATAGTNGNINRWALPGDYRVIWTGMKVTKHDDTQHHGVGILPTHPVQRTIAAIAAGRDEYLEIALEIVRSKDQ